MFIINNTHIVDLDKGIVFNSETQFRSKLGTNEIALLRFMMNHVGQTFSKKELLEEVWSTRGVIVEDSSLLYTISMCRKALEDKNGDVIRTERRVGYCFVGSIEAYNETAPSRNEAASEETDTKQNKVPVSFSADDWIKCSAVFIVGFLVTFLSHDWINDLFNSKPSEPYHVEHYNTCKFQSLLHSTQIAYKDVSIYTVNELSLLITKNGQSLSYPAKSKVVVCE